LSADYAILNEKDSTMQIELMNTELGLVKKALKERQAEAEW
jgi:hypothetical protein